MTPWYWILVSFLQLKPHRDAERVRAVNLGLIPDPLKPRRLDEALPFFGTCTQMCPEFERHEREYQNNTDRWERVSSARSDTFNHSASDHIWSFDSQDLLLWQYPGTMRIDPLKAVKAFHRPAAGNDQPLPSDVRPPHILKVHVIPSLAASSLCLRSIDRLRRSIRQLSTTFSMIFCPKNHYSKPMDLSEIVLDQSDKTSLCKMSAALWRSSVMNV